jgi:hypothetical protein
LEAELIVGYENTRETEALKKYYDERERERGLWCLATLSTIFNISNCLFLSFAKYNILT